jgi:hypothetical protein
VLKESYDQHKGRVALSFIAEKTLVPGADDRRNERYVQDYIIAVQDVARYVAYVDMMRTSFLETKVKQFMASLSKEQQEVGCPLFEQLRAVMNPSMNPDMRLVDVDMESFSDGK